MPRPPILAAHGLCCRFVSPPSLAERIFLSPARRAVLAVDGVSFQLEQGRTLAVVGESGCGKSTLARCIAGLQTPTAGSIEIDRVEVASPAGPRFNPEQRRAVQMVFQNPDSSLNPRMRAGSIVAEPLRTFAGLRGAQAEHRVHELLRSVGLEAGVAVQYPHELSGGERQRISIARALAAEPRLLVLDEPTSALDVSAQARVLNVLVELQRSLGLAYLFLSHDIALVAQVADEIMVLRDGAICEHGLATRVLAAPEHPYTRELLGAA